MPAFNSYSYFQDLPKVLQNCPVLKKNFHGKISQICQNLDKLPYLESLLVEDYKKKTRIERSKNKKRKRMKIKISFSFKVLTDS